MHLSVAFLVLSQFSQAEDTQKLMVHNAATHVAAKEMTREAWDESRRRARATGKNQPIILARTMDMARVNSLLSSLKREGIPLPQVMHINYTTDEFQDYWRKLLSSSETFIVSVNGDGRPSNRTLKLANTTVRTYRASFSTAESSRTNNRRSRNVSAQHVILPSGARRVYTDDLGSSTQYGQTVVVPGGVRSEVTDDLGSGSRNGGVVVLGRGVNETSF